MSDHVEAVAAYLARQPVYDRRRRWLHAFLRGLVDTLSRGEITGLEHLPPAGGTILMMNHASAIDPVLCTRLVATRYVITMAKRETLRNPPIALFNALWGNFTVQRGLVDRSALHSTIELLRQGQMVLIAPEGTRNRAGLGPPRDGVAYVAARAEAWVVPVAVVGTDHWWQRLLTLRPARWRVHCGRAFRFRLPPGGKISRADRDRMMQEAMYQLALAMPPEYARYRGVYHDVAQATTTTLLFADAPPQAL
ncbi:MAG: 1-acyl-sn-glycerol-3-phosphate acyltransferase [Anaerolineae bacterium]|jgi:1-acyl-sn-glycerol-3-phosphate acyltransferase|nr:1-acyl-sn-glycerol-3-phosphate acyltransferase [Anaerolineae bacterium]